MTTYTLTTPDRSGTWEVQSGFVVTAGTMEIFTESSDHTYTRHTTSIPLTVEGGTTHFVVTYHPSVFELGGGAEAITTGPFAPTANLTFDEAIALGDSGGATPGPTTLDAIIALVAQAQAAAASAAASAAAASVTSTREVVNGVAGLDGSGKLFDLRLPDRIRTASTTREYATIAESGTVAITHPAYGADPTGVTAVNTAVNAASAAASPFGGSVMFPPGTYKITANLVVGVVNQRWIFAPGATLQSATVAAGKAIDINASGVMIVGPGKIDGGVVSGSSCVFVEPGLSDVTVMGMELVNGTYGVRCKGANNTALNTRIHVVDCHIHGGTGNGVTFNASTTDSDALRNEIHDCGGAGVWAGGDGCDRLIVAGNHITNVAGQGVGFNGVTAAGTGPIGAPNSVVSGNTIVGCGAIGISLNCSDGAKCIGNDVKNAGVYGLEIAMSSRCSLIGNTVTTPANNGISVSAVSLACDDNLIQGNLIIAPGGNGVIMGGSANGAKRTRIIGNEVVDAGNGTPTPAFTNATGIGCTDVIYANNIVRWTALSGTPSTGFSLNMPNAIVIGNELIYDAAITTAGGTGIQVAATALNATLTNNTVEGNGKCATGINLVVGVTGVVVGGNNVFGTTVDSIKNNSVSTTNHFYGNTVLKTSGNGLNIGTAATGIGNRDLSEAFSRISGGVKIGASALDTLGFYGVAPIARPTGWAASTGTATRTAFATSTVTLPQLAEQVKAIKDDLIALGLIGA